MKRLICIIILVFFLFFIYGNYINTKDLEVKEYEITSNKITDGFDGIKIVQFSDILYYEKSDIKEIKNLVKSINNENANIIVFTGDLVLDNTNITNVINELNNIKADYKYAVLGDKDNDNIKSNLESIGFTVLDKNYDYIFNKDINVKVDYLTFNTNSDYVDKCLKIYEENMDNDLKLGYTSTGIQKDDFSLKIDGKDIGKFGSQGENRIASLILKLSIYELSEIINKPILILDDILSELDKNNESLLLKYLNKVQQVFITSTKKYDIENCHYCYLTK